MASSDAFCISFDTPYDSDGFISQVLYIPAGRVYLEVKYKEQIVLTVRTPKVYIQLIGLGSNKVDEFVLNPESNYSVFPISQLSGENVELRLGVKGRGCTMECYVYVDYIRILLNSTTAPTATIFTTVFTTTTTVSTISTTTVALTNTMVQLPLFTIPIDVLSYIYIIVVLAIAAGFSMLIYEGVQPLHERKIRRIGLGFALSYGPIAGIIVWQAIPLLFRSDLLISTFAHYMNLLLIFALLAVFTVPIIMILRYIRMILQHNKRGTQS
jgi:hypothetical protein